MLFTIQLRHTKNSIYPFVMTSPPICFKQKVLCHNYHNYKSIPTLPSASPVGTLMAGFGAHGEVGNCM